MFLCCDVPGDILIGSNASTNSSRAPADTIRIGGGYGTEDSSSAVYIGYNSQFASTGAVVSGRDVNIGCSKSSIIRLQCNGSSSIRFCSSAGYAAGSGSFINANNATLGTASSLTYKENIINKTQNYILNQTSPIKNYYQRIIDCPIYSYTFIGKKEIHQGPSFEYLYEHLPAHTLGVMETLDEPNKKPIEWYDDTDPEKMKTIRKNALVDYIVLALQEQDKFIIKPLQEKYDDLKNKYDNLVSYLKTQQILPNNF